MTMITRSASKRSAPPVAAATTSSKRRRRRHCAQTTVDDDAQESPWVSLPADMVRLIGNRLLADGDGDGLLDYVRFRAVCGHWRASTDSPRGRGVVDARFRPTRWVMLPERGKLRRRYNRFFNLSTGTVVRVDKLPLFSDHRVLDSVDGLLLMQRDHDTAVRLLNPLTGDTAELPPLSTLLEFLSALPIDPRFKNLESLRNIGATAVGVSPDDGTTITVTAALITFPFVLYATAGGERWHWKISRFSTFAHRMLSFQGKIYRMILCNPPAAGEQPECKVLEINVNAAAGRLTAKEKMLVAFPISSQWFKPVHMAAVGSEILLVVGADSRRHNELKLLNLADCIKGNTAAAVQSIGPGNVLLYGPTCLAVSSRALPGIPGDCIVTGDLLGSRVPHLHAAVKSPAADLVRGSVTWPSGLRRPRSHLIYSVFRCNDRPTLNEGSIVYVKDSKWTVEQKFRIRA